MLTACKLDKWYAESFMKNESDKRTVSIATSIHKDIDRRFTLDKALMLGVMTITSFEDLSIFQDFINLFLPTQL